jgi:hypothetical protein
MKKKKKKRKKEKKKYQKRASMGLKIYKNKGTTVILHYRVLFDRKK